MPLVDLVERRAYQRSYVKGHYKRHKAQYIARARAHDRKVARECQRVIRCAKAIRCKDCRRRYPYYVMDLDHVRGKKLFNIGQFRSHIRSFCSIKKLLDEIAKCEVVCANCHRKRSFKRQRAQGRRHAS